MSTKIIEVIADKGEKKFYLYEVKQATLEDGTITSILDEESRREVSEKILSGEKNGLLRRITEIDAMLDQIKPKGI